MQIIIFTDLDGTLLDEDTYSFKKAITGLKRLKEKNIPLIFCTSKTRAEIEFYRKKLHNNHPFISENGGGIFIPKCYFTHGNRKGYSIIRFGEDYSKIIRVIKEIKKKYNIKCFYEMSAEELAKL